MNERESDLAEVVAFLNEREQKREIRRTTHRLPAEWYSSSEVVWSVTLCARHQGKPFESVKLATGVISALRFYQERGLWQVYAYCLMPDHLHAVVRLERGFVETDSPLPHLVALLGRFKRYTTTQIAWKQGFHGVLWQREFYDHACRGQDDAENQCRYVLDNPVRKGLVRDWRDYPYAGLMDKWA